MVLHETINQRLFDSDREETDFGNAGAEKPGLRSTHRRSICSLQDPCGLIAHDYRVTVYFVLQSPGYRG